MYTFYYLPGTCSLGIHALLNELGVEFKSIHRDDAKDFTTLNPSNKVPLLVDGDTVIFEGVAIAIYLMEKHNSPMLPKDLKARANALKWMTFANASLHPAYGRVFFALMKLEGEPQKVLVEKAIPIVESLWEQVDAQLAKTKFICGDKPTVADFFLATYANWGPSYGFDVKLGANVKRLVKEVANMPSFKAALQAEKIEHKLAA